MLGLTTRISRLREPGTDPSVRRLHPGTFGSDDCPSPNPVLANPMVDQKAPEDEGGFGGNANQENGGGVKEGVG